MIGPKTLKIDMVEPPALPTARDEIIDMLRSKDIELPPKPCANGESYTPSVPANLSDQPPAIVAETLQELNSYYGYLMGQYTIAKVVSENIKAVLEYKELLARERLDRSLTEKRKDAETKLDVAVHKWRQKYYLSKNDKDILKSLLDIAERNIKTVSRIVAIMEQEVLSGARTHNIGRKTRTNVLARLKSSTRSS